MLWDVESMEKRYGGKSVRKYTKFVPIGLFLFVILTIVFFLSSFSSNLDTMNDVDPTPPFPHLKDLIMVAGHAIYLGSDLTKIESDEGWILEPYQKGGQVKTFLKHIQTGMEMAKANPLSLLVYSGGETRIGAGAMSEAQSYYWIAQKLFSGNDQDTTSLIPFERATTEEHAKDSLENLLFSLCRFKEMTGKYPKNYTVIGFEFKKKRFTEIHRYSIRFPLERFNYIGIDSDDSPMKGESSNSYGPFQEDLYGCHGSLSEKKKNRNPFRQHHGYRSSCPELSILMSYCPKDRTKLYSGHLPWDL
jgi:hypothetical protein